MTRCYSSAAAFAVMVAILLVSRFAVAADSPDIAALRAKAEQGDMLAEYGLGSAYHSGSGGLPVDDIKSVEWIRKSAEQNYAPAQEAIGYAYYTGRGVQQNYSEAVKWIRMAAEQGDGGAQVDLGSAYEQGVGGVPKDAVQAYQWYTLSMLQGNQYAAQYISDLNKTMTSAQIAKAEQMASEWKSQHASRLNPH